MFNHSNITVIENFLKSLEKKGISSERYYKGDRWIITIPHQSPEIKKFQIEILLNRDWISLLSLISRNLKGDNVAQFYEGVSRLNSRLNGLKMAINDTGKYITLQTDIHIKGLEPQQKMNSLSDALKSFYAFYGEYYPSLIAFAATLGLRYLMEGEDSNLLPQYADKILH